MKATVKQVKESILRQVFYDLQYDEEDDCWRYGGTTISIEREEMETLAKSKDNLDSIKESSQRYLESVRHLSTN